MILYLHGFRSSPQSFKARLLGEHLAAVGRSDAYACPQLPPEPAAAIDMALGLARSVPPNKLCLIGSSLGGFYATVLAETPARRGWRVGLVNPAVDPARDLAAHIGEQAAWHDPAERFFFQPAFVDELRAMTPAAITDRARYLPLIATGDEVLDWREMATRYAGEPLLVVPGSDHALSDFDDHLPRLLRHLCLSP